MYGFTLVHLVHHEVSHMRLSVSCSILVLDQFLCRIHWHRFSLHHLQRVITNYQPQKLL